METLKWPKAGPGGHSKQKVSKMTNKCYGCNRKILQRDKKSKLRLIRH